MNLKLKYRFISALLSASIFFGMTSPILGHSLMLIHCSTSMADDSTNHEQMNMNKPLANTIDDEDCSSFKMLTHHSSKVKESTESLTCDPSINCLCEFTSKSVKDETFLTHKIKTHQVFFKITNIDVLIAPIQSFKSFIYLSDSYSPPSLFLANESFLI